MCGAAAEAREALIAFLKTEEPKRPHALVGAPGKDAAGAGFLTPSFAEGSLLLKNRSGAYFRLEWPKDDRPSPSAPGSKPAPDRRRALPPGEYTLTNYRIVRRDAKGGDWFISATAPDLRRIVVRAGDEQRVPVGETIHMTCRAPADHGGIKIQLKIAGEEGSGLSIYQNGKRIGINYRVTDAQGKNLASGPLEYG